MTGPGSFVAWWEGIWVEERSAEVGQKEGRKMEERESSHEQFDLLGDDSLEVLG